MTTPPTTLSIADVVYEAGTQAFWSSKGINAEGQCFAAVLRTVTDHVMPDEWPHIEDFNEYDQGFAAAHIRYRNQFLDIADELEGMK